MAKHKPPTEKALVEVLNYLQQEGEVQLLSVLQERVNYFVARAAEIKAREAGEE